MALYPVAPGDAQSAIAQRDAHLTLEGEIPIGTSTIAPEENTPQTFFSLAATQALVPFEIRLPALPDAYDINGAIYTLYMYDAYPDRVHIQFPAKDPAVESAFMLIEYIGPDGTFALTCADPVETLDLNGTTVFLVNHSSDTKTKYRLHFIDGDILYNITCPNITAEKPLALPGSCCNHSPDDGKRLLQPSMGAAAFSCAMRSISCVPRYSPSASPNQAYTSAVPQPLMLTMS